MSTKTRKKYFVTAPNGSIAEVAHSRKEAREFRIPFLEKIVKVEYKVAKNGTIEIINQKQVR